MKVKRTFHGTFFFNSRQSLVYICRLESTCLANALVEYEETTRKWETTLDLWSYEESPAHFYNFLHRPSFCECWYEGTGNKSD